MNCELAWLAGIFEGEGSTFLKGTKSRYADKNMPYIKIGMTDRDVVERVQRVAGFGTIYSEVLKSGTTLYTWHSGKRTEVPALLRKLRPWLGARRQVQVDVVLAGALPYGYEKRSKPRVVIHG